MKDPNNIYEKHKDIIDSWCDFIEDLSSSTSVSSEEFRQAVINLSNEAYRCGREDMKNEINGFEKGKEIWN